MSAREVLELCARGGDNRLRADVERAERLGAPETVYAAAKTPKQVVEALTSLSRSLPERAVLATRCTDATLIACREAFGTKAVISDLGHTVVLGPLPRLRGRVAVVAGGTGDLPVVSEAMTTIAVHGAFPESIVDVGVAGLHRLFEQLARIRQADVVVVIAGLEGALASVVGGLVDAPIIAVPTSIGYGVGEGGRAALSSMLCSCAPGVVVVNIDNGYGAGVAAARIACAMVPVKVSDSQ